MATKERQIADLRVTILSHIGHLNRYVAHGDRVLAHQMVDDIIDGVRELEDLTGERPRWEPAA